VGLQNTGKSFLVHDLVGNHLSRWATEGAVVNYSGLLTESEDYDLGQLERYSRLHHETGSLRSFRIDDPASLAGLRSLLLGGTQTEKKRMFLVLKPGCMLCDRERTLDILACARRCCTVDLFVILEMMYPFSCPGVDIHPCQVRMKHRAYPTHQQFHSDLTWV